MVAQMLEVQLDLVELWLQAESFVLPGCCLDLRGLFLFLAHSPHLTPGTSSEAACSTSGLSTLIALPVLGSGKNDAAVWGGQNVHGLC